MSASFPHGTPVYTTADVRRIEALAASLPDKPQLMERAGLAAAEIARRISGGSGRPVLIFAGPGNNGGDAFVLARHLKAWWFNATVHFSGDEAKLPADAAAAMQAWRAAGGGIVSEMPARQDWGLIVDGLFGIGLQREVAGRHAELVAWINAADAPVLALDVPSGIASDSGRVMGRAVRADHTVTFIALKPGLLTLDGPDHCGALHVATLDLDAPALLAPRGTVIGAEMLARAYPPRAANTHKGDYGSAGIIGGAHGMVGAALLAGRAALRLGAGRVYAGLLARDAPAVDPLQPELMLRGADDVLRLDHLTALAVGPGLGQSPDAALYLDWALGTPAPLVIDADGLNLLATGSVEKTVLKQRVSETILTPHPAEAARLLGSTTREVQRDRVAAALRIAAEYNSLVVLKGAGSICAAPDGTWAINTTGNPGMASAGMGDVLTGILAALLAQGVNARDALHAAVWLHGAAADALVAGGTGPAGLTAGEVTEAARGLVNARHPSISKEH
jgi:hydroxyethylthiazole kinase-like uncharacterized protein yjeF